MAPNTAAVPSSDLLADLFHALNQPLTTLQCSLELALAREHTISEYKQCLQSALEQAESVSWLSASVRQLVEARNPPEIETKPIGCLPIAFEQYVREAAEEWTPIAKSLGHELCLGKLCLGEACRGAVFIDATQLRQALFYCFDWIVETTLPPGLITAELCRQGHTTVLTISTSRNPASSGAALIPSNVASPSGEKQIRTVALKRRLKIELARVIVGSPGGDLQAYIGEWPSLVFQLPLAKPLHEAAANAGRG